MHLHFTLPLLQHGVQAFKIVDIRKFEKVIMFWSSCRYECSFSRSALATMKIFLIRSQSLELSEFLDSEEIWDLFDDVETFPEAVCGFARCVILRCTVFSSQTKNYV